MQEGNMTPSLIWKKASARLIPYAILSLAGAACSIAFGRVRMGTIDHRLIALVGVIAFVFFSGAFLHALSNTFHNLMSKHRQRLAARQAGAIRFMIRTLGYVAILFTTLELIGVSVERLLLGSAVLGIILGVAAQQALANFFASIILVIARPFGIGDYITLNSGALGGKYTGTVLDIGLTHTRLKQRSGSIVLLPNSTLLSQAAFMPGEDDDPQIP
jgi:small-conductance mechanosensitive channel